jgi:hypothetical protein
MAWRARALKSIGVFVMRKYDSTPRALAIGKMPVARNSQFFGSPFDFSFAYLGYIDSGSR